MFKNYTTSKIAVENLTEAQKKKYKHFDNNNYLKQLKNFHEMHEAKAKSINFRNKLLERQKIANYQNEVERIRGVMSQTNMNERTMEGMKKREEELKEMIKNIN